MQKEFKKRRKYLDSMIYPEFSIKKWRSPVYAVSKPVECPKSQHQYGNNYPLRFRDASPFEQALSLMFFIRTSSETDVWRLLNQCNQPPGGYPAPNLDQQNIGCLYTNWSMNKSMNTIDN